MVNYSDASKDRYNQMVEAAEAIQGIQQLGFAPAFQELTSDKIRNAATSEDIVAAEKLRAELHAVANLGIAALMNEADTLFREVGGPTQQPFKYEMTYVFAKDNDFPENTLVDEAFKQPFARSGRDLVEISMKLGDKEIDVTIPAALLKNHEELYQKAAKGDMPTATLAEHKAKVDAYLASPEGQERTAQLAEMSIEQIKEQQLSLETTLMTGRGLLVGQDAVLEAARTLNPHYFEPEAVGSHYEKGDNGKIANQEQFSTVNSLKAMKEKTYPGRVDVSASQDSIQVIQNTDVAQELEQKYQEREERKPKLRKDRPVADIEEVTSAINPQQVATASKAEALERGQKQAAL